MVHDEIEDELIRKEACETHVASNNTFRGVWRDKKHGEPPNAITSTKAPSCIVRPLTHDSLFARERCGTHMRKADGSWAIEFLDKGALKPPNPRLPQAIRVVDGVLLLNLE